MKYLSLLVLMAICSAPALAREVRAKCVRTTDGSLIENKYVTVEFDRKTIIAKAAGKTFKGTFSKVARTGADMYDSQDAADLADQTDAGYIFVSPGLAKGGDGNLTFSAHQLGDSEGAWYVSETFS